MAKQKINAYEAVGLKPGASPEEIAAAYNSFCGEISGMNEGELKLKKAAFEALYKGQKFPENFGELDFKSRNQQGPSDSSFKFSDSRRTTRPSSRRTLEDTDKGWLKRNKLIVAIGGGLTSVALLVGGVFLSLTGNKVENKGKDKIVLKKPEDRLPVSKDKVNKDKDKGEDKATTEKDKDKDKIKEPEKKNKIPKILSVEEKNAVADCAKLIAGCQLNKGAGAGAVRMKADGDPIWVVPYFAHEGILADLAAQQRNPKDKSSILRAAKWLKFCLDNDKGGFTPEFEGSLSGNTFEMKKDKDTGKPYSDAVDSDAALRLAVAYRFAALRDTLPKEMKTKEDLINLEIMGALSDDNLKKLATASLKALETLKDESGLTYAKDSYKVMFLMDNCEVHYGLKCATPLFKKLGLEDEAARAEKMAEKIGGELKKFWDDDKKCYAWARHPNGVFEVSLDKKKPYPDALAQLFALASIDGEKEQQTQLWERLKKDFSPSDKVPHARWLMAAEALHERGHIGKEEVTHWREKALKAAQAYNKNNTYVDAPGISVIAIAEGGFAVPVERAKALER